MLGDMQEELRRIEEGDAWLETDEPVDLEVKRPLDRVIPVRLSSEQWSLLRQEAREIGVGPSTLARMWILAKLREARAGKQMPKDAIREAINAPIRKQSRRPARESEPA